MLRHWESGDIALINVEDGQQEDQLLGSYVDLAVYRDMVFAADGSSVDVFEADSNSLEEETSGLLPAWIASQRSSLAISMTMTQTSNSLCWMLVRTRSTSTNLISTMTAQA